MHVLRFIILFHERTRGLLISCILIPVYGIVFTAKMFCCNSIIRFVSLSEQFQLVLTIYSVTLLDFPKS